MPPRRPRGGTAVAVLALPLLLLLLPASASAVPAAAARPTPGRAPAATSAPAAELGHVDFPTSGSTAALHYLIHSYDDPVHAPLGLRAARVYAQVAPAASHAQHVISHIYVALGRWKDSVTANETSFAVAAERRERKGLGVDALNFHALHWLDAACTELAAILDGANWDVHPPAACPRSERTAPADERWRNPALEGGFGKPGKRGKGGEGDGRPPSGG